MGIFEITAVTSTLICVYLTAKQNIWCWPIGIVGVIAFLILFIDQGLYALIGLQVIYIVQGLYGWHNWSKVKDDMKLPVKKLSTKVLLLSIVGTIIVSLGFGYLLDTSTESTVPYLDALGSFLSVLANWYLAKKIWQSWHIWIFVNILLFTLFMLQGLYLSALMEVILWGFSINGLISWRKDLKTALS